MRSVLRCAFQAFRSPQQQVATKQLIFGTRSAAKTAPNKLITTFCDPKLQSIVRFSPIQQRFYSSSDDKKAYDQHISSLKINITLKNNNKGAAFVITKVDPPEKAVQLFTKLQEKVGNSPSILYGKAEALRHLGRFNEALELLDQLSAISPDEPVSALKGLIHLQMKNFELAVENFEDAAKRFTNNVQILSYLGKAYMRVGRVPDAVETLQYAHQLDPNDWNVVHYLSNLFNSLGPSCVNEALTYAQRAVELQPDMALMWHNLAVNYNDIGEYEKAEECFEKMQSLDPVMGSFNHAYLLLQMNKVDEAEKMFRKVTSLKTDNHGALPFPAEKGDNMAFRVNEALLKLYIAQKRHKEAKELAEQLSKSMPFQTYPWYQLGLIMMTSNIDEAITYFEHALNIDSEDQYALDGLASCYFIKGQYDKAEEYFKRTRLFTAALVSNQMLDQARSVIEFLFKKFPELANQIYRAQAQVYAHKQDYKAEFESYKKQLETSTDPIDHANLMLLNNDFEGVMNALDQLLAVDPNSLDAITTKAITLVEEDRVKEALALLSDHEPEYFDQGYAEALATTLSRDDDLLDKAEEVCKQFNSLYASHMAMSEVHRRRGNYEQALKSWRTSQKINQSSPEHIFPTSFPYRYLMHQQLAKILESMGDVEGAMKEYNTVLSINPLELFSKQRLEALKTK